MAIRVVCQCNREIRAPDDLAGKTVKCPQCGRNVPIPPATSHVNPPGSPGGGAESNVGEPLPPPTLAQRLSSALPFYWSQRTALRSILGELIQPLRSPADTAREIRISPTELERMGKRTGSGWSLELPECCVVCGELTAAPPATETCDAWDLTWPVIVPAAILSFVMLGSLLLCSPWLFLLALPIAPLAGGLARRKSVIGLSLSRCNNHRTRFDLPRLWSFGNTLVIRAGDAEVVEAFHDPDRLILRRQQQIIAARERQSSDSPTAGQRTDRPVTSAARTVSATPPEQTSQHSGEQPEGWQLAPRDVAQAASGQRRCLKCGGKLLPRETTCPHCHARQQAHAGGATMAARAVASGTFEPEDEEPVEPMSMWAAIGKLILSITELALCLMLFCILGAGAVFFAERWEITTRAGIDLDRILLVDLGVHPLAMAAIYASALGLMLYYGATGLAVRNGVLLAVVAVALAWYFQWPFELWRVGVAAAVAGMALGVLQAMFEGRFAEPLGALLAPGEGLLPGRPSAAGLIALAKGAIMGGVCGFLLGAAVGFPVYWYGSASGWEIGEQGVTHFALTCGVLTGIALAYLVGQFGMTRAERIGAMRGMLLGAELWGFSSLVAAATMIGIALAQGQDGRSGWQLAMIGLLVVAGATISGGLVGWISGKVGGNRNRVVISKLR